jgi:hypothetical protein
MFALVVAVMTASVSLKVGARGCGADAQRPITTDRPQITNSSVVVPCGSLQFENGFEQAGSGGRQGFDLPEMSVRFGVTDQTELRFSVPNCLYNEDTPLPASSIPVVCRNAAVRNTSSILELRTNSLRTSSLTFIGTSACLQQFRITRLASATRYGSRQLDFDKGKRCEAPVQEAERVRY